MNERFRFRAWHKPTKKLFDVFSFTDEIVFENTLDGVGNSPTNPAKLADCVLEQCTGLKDKNGKLIYEGDIVAYSGIDLWWVVFEEKYCSFELLRKDGMSVSVSVHKEMTVVGNVHENPALLEVKE